MQQFETLNRQQQPFIQSGYGALGKLNTLLGIGARPRSGPMPLGGNASLMPRGPAPPVINNGPYGPGVRVPPRLPGGSGSGPKMAPRAMGNGNVRLKQILMLRAMNGDTEAARMMEMV